MKRLYQENSLAIFQMGTLRIDGRELDLCFHVESEAAHAALAGRSNCCVLYLKLVRPSGQETRSLCAVVTAGKVAALYPGRNGVFCDRDGLYWEATVTKVIEHQVSLVEAFWSPWKKLGEGIAATVKKFLGERQKTAESNLATLTTPQKDAEAQQARGAALASSVAAIGIGVGMVGAAFASLMAVVSTMVWWQLIVSLVALVLVVSLPSMVLAWFKLRQRDLSAILNASGWAINRPMRFSVARARAFTRCR
jgi:N-acetylglutamate synthase/N-acetylornithine aminotransferase